MTETTYTAEQNPEVYKLSDGSVIVEYDETEDADSNGG